MKEMVKEFVSLELLDRIRNADTVHVLGTS